MTRLLTKTDVAAVLTLEECIPVVEKVFRDHAEGRLPASQSLGVHAERGTFHVKVARADVLAAKINANFPGNPASFGLPTIQGVIVVMDLAHGTPIGILDSALITTMRTAAAVAVAARYLAREDAATAAFVGCGPQGRACLEALRHVRSLRAARLWDTDARALDTCARDFQSDREIEVVAATSLDAAVDGADIIVTCTPSKRPFLNERHVQPGLFIAAVGADNPEKCEIAPELMAHSAIVPDLLEQAATTGDLYHAIASGCLTRDDVHGELGQVICGQAPGRRTADESFIFDSTGSALQDVVVAALAIERASRRSIGMEVSL